MVQRPDAIQTMAKAIVKDLAPISALLNADAVIF